MHTSSKNLFFTGQLICCNSTDDFSLLDLQTASRSHPWLLYRTYTAFSYSVSATVHHGKVQHCHHLDLSFRKVFLRLQLDLLVRLRLECCSSAVVVLLFVVHFRRIKPLILSQEHEQVSRKKRTVHSSPDILERISEQLAAGYNQSPGPSYTF